jgi:arabinogalactan oligomer/maltooligosaccharide transport system permease protein
MRRLQLKNTLALRASKYLISFLIAFLILLMGVRFLNDKAWFLATFFVISAALIFFTYSVSKKTPGKYLLPGVLLLCLFHIYPAFYSGAVAFTNDSNGHQLSKAQAINAIMDDSKIPIETTDPISYKTLIEKSSKKVFILFEYPQSTFWLGNSDQVEQIQGNSFEFEMNSSVPNIKGFETVARSNASNYVNELQNISVTIDSGVTFQPQDIEILEASSSTFKYDSQEDRLTNTFSGETYTPNGNGEMQSSKGEILYPGWKANVGWKNFTSIITDKEIRRPLVAVLIWTFVNAFLVVFVGFLVGLILALIFNSPHLRSKRIYRTIFIVPLAIPSVLSVLVWAGLFTAETGVIDRLFHISTPWLTDPWWARLAVLIVELWSVFPYMFLIATGAIQAIPGEILEAAEIDGASPLKSFTQIKLPLVVRTLGPLLVASIAMALNNFGAIYLLTGGGPTFSNSNGNAGATDILISYTYKLAFNSAGGNNYGLASALSILNFILVGLISIYGLRKMKTMEEIS